MASISKINPQRGDIFLVDFDPNIGSEIQKIRPAIIIQNDIDNKYSPVTITAAITSYKGEHLYATEILIEKGDAGLICDSVILLNQIRTVDKQRLIKKLGRVGDEILDSVDIALQLSLGIIKL
jgi:mRNA interferase MazF